MTKIDPNNVPEGAVALRLTDGSYTLVDPDVADALQGYRLWRAGKGYVQICGRKRPMYLHQFVLGVKPACDIHHRNANKDDNRRENLQHLSRADHVRLARCTRGNQTGFQGVRPRNDIRRFYATASLDGRVFRGLHFREPLLATFQRDDYFDAHGIVGLRAFDRAVSPGQLLALLESTLGRFFTVWFVKRSDGQIRRMNCRLRPKADSPGLKFDPRAAGLLPVWDTEAREYRFINLEGVLCLRMDGKSYRLDHRRAVAA
jgi:hypothetical protein